MVEGEGEISSPFNVAILLRNTKAPFDFSAIEIEMYIYLYRECVCETKMEQETRENYSFFFILIGTPSEKRLVFQREHRFRSAATALFSRSPACGTRSSNSVLSARRNLVFASARATGRELAALPVRPSLRSCRERESSGRCDRIGQLQSIRAPSSMRRI
jgi:hypothetical protein